jgi:hypothetical protein
MKAGLDAIKNAKVIATYINGTKVYGN